MKRNVWMIRPPSGRDYEEACVNGMAPADAGVRGDCSHVLELEDASSLVIDSNPKMSVKSQDSRARSLHLLISGIMPGDPVIIPLKGRGSVVLAIARPENGVACGYPARRVEVIREMSGGLPADIANSMSAHACVCEVRAPDAEARFRALVTGESAPPPVSGCPWSGHDFAKIVADILEGDGYLCQIAPPGPDGGVDIRAGRGVTGTDGAVIVQVKATGSPVGVAEVDRLLGIVSPRGARGMIVSWSGLTEKARSRVSGLWPLISSWDGSDVLRAMRPTGSPSEADPSQSVAGD